MSAVQAIKRLVPEPWRGPMRRTYIRLVHVGLRFRCNICGARLRSFIPHGIPPEPNFLCPLCRSKPPHRLAAVYFDAHPELFFRGGILLHVAPESGLGQKLVERARECDMSYRCGGIAGVGDQYIDLLSLPFDTNSISLVYCCHVLNALQEDTAAMREIHRVLHPEGVALLQVPAFYQGATTLETNRLEDRMAVFGDEGIYRCYTNADYEARLRVAGFEVRAFRASDVADDLVQRYQLKREVLHVCRKRNETGT